MAFIVLKRQMYQWGLFVVQQWFITIPCHFCLLLFHTGWNTVVTWFPWAVFYTPKHLLLFSHSLSVSHNTQIMINFDFGCWHGLALSHVYCHTGLLGHVKSCQVLKYGHNEKYIQINKSNKLIIQVIVSSWTPCKIMCTNIYSTCKLHIQ